MERQVKLKWEEVCMQVLPIFQTVDFHDFAWSPADKFFNVPNGHLSPLVATILGLNILR